MSVPVERREILQLRARVVVLEKMAMAALELTLRVRPEELERRLEAARRRLSADYLEADFAVDIIDVDERAFVAREVERLMRGLQSDLGLLGGISTFESG